MHQTLPHIDFGSIRSIRGKQTDGFEELSVQLFHGETEGQGEFFRIDGSGGDGGVEAYREQPNGEKIGLQSKYWDDLGDPQWRQITKSVKTALKNHPGLRCYIISTPLNRNPTQTDKWKQLVKTWLNHAKTLGITHSIEFLWWGHSELAVLLAKGCYRNQLVYWLGLPDFSSTWLKTINRSNIELLGKRYSPKQHIDTNSGQRLEAFAWGDDGKKRIVNAFIRVAEKWRALDRRSVARANTTPDTEELTKSFRKAMRNVLAFRWPDHGYPLIRPANKQCREAIDACHDLEWKLRELNQTEKEKRAKEKGRSESYQSGPYEGLIHDFRQLAETLADLLEQTNLCQTADDSKLLVLGEAGSGKSHLLGDLVDSAQSRSQPVLLLLGEQFLENGDPWTTSIEVLGWHHSADDLLAALDQEATLARRPALLCIDALNESEHRRLWQSHLIQFADRVARYPNIKLLVSCRSDFARITLPESVRPGAPSSWSCLQHQGFGAEVIEAIEVYFEAFGVRTSYFPPSLAEFRNPLFLRVFCEAFEDQELPNGPLGLDRVMRARVDRLCSQIQKEIDCDPEDTRSALQAIAKEIANNGGRPIPRKTARARAAEHFPNRGASGSLYGRLLSNGILVESVKFSPKETGDQEVIVRFPFERFSDYFVATQILNGIRTEDEFRTLFKPKGRLAFYRDYWNYYENRGVARALAILAPERLKLELAEILEEAATRELVLEDFLESLVWRSACSISAKSSSVLTEARELGTDLLPTYLRLATIPQHPFNSEFLGQRLASLALPERELAWTIPISNLSAWEDESVLSEFLDWSFRAPTRLIPDEQALLAGRVLLWFCTSNHRALRKRSTLAAIRLLVGRPHAIGQLVSELHGINDPYVVERLYAVAAGVAMRLPGGEGLSKLAGIVHAHVFAQGNVTPNILIRDFASTVLEAAVAKGCSPTGVVPESFRPPFNTSWPAIPSDDEVKRFEDDESWCRIVSSVRSEGMGGYGDFGRYVMDSAVHRFSDRPRSQPKPAQNYRGHFPGTTTRRWILQRVEELGWTGERFSKYERHSPYGRQRHDIEELKLERISKKYQWIALREFLGFLADHYWLDQSWSDRESEFVGAWQLWAREFDPSQRLVDLSDEDESDNTSARRWQSDYADPFKDLELCEDREAWVTCPPDDFMGILTPKDGTPDHDQRWLALAGHHEWVESEYDRVTRGRRGTLKMWVNVRSFLVRKGDLEHFVTKASQQHFYGHGVGFPEEHKGWIGEFPWGGAFAEMFEWCDSPDERVGKVGVPYSITVCQWSGGSTLIPSPQLCDLLDLEWAGEGGMFVTKRGEPIVGHLGGDAADWGRPLIIRQESLNAALDAAGLHLVWCVVAERSCWCSETTTHIAKKEQEISAVYWLEGEVIKGGLTQTIIQTLGGR